MTGHYQKKTFNVKFDLDLGVIKAKIVSLSKKLFLLSILVSIARPGFSLFSERGSLARKRILESASGFFFFSAKKTI